MAIWQFSLFPIPIESMKTRFEIVPAKLSIDDAEDTPWWLGHQPAKGFEDGIVRMLGESPSWSKSMRNWVSCGPAWVKVAMDAWTALAAVVGGYVFRPVNRGGVPPQLEMEGAFCR